MGSHVHQKYIDARPGDTIRIQASEKSASVLYRGEIRRVASDMRLTWSDKEIEDDVSFVFTKDGSYYVEILATFVTPNQTTKVTTAVDGGEPTVVDLDSDDGLVHLISVAVDVFRS